jgi:hypothetical protein
MGLTYFAISLDMERIPETVSRPVVFGLVSRRSSCLDLEALMMAFDVRMTQYSKYWVSRL